MSTDRSRDAGLALRRVAPADNRARWPRWIPAVRPSSRRRQAFTVIPVWPTARPLHSVRAANPDPVARERPWVPRRIPRRPRRLSGQRALKVRFIKVHAMPNGQENGGCSGGGRKDAVWGLGHHPSQICDTRSFFVSRDFRPWYPAASVRERERHVRSSAPPAELGQASRGVQTMPRGLARHAPILRLRGCGSV